MTFATCTYVRYISTTMMIERICPHCGQPILEGSLFCLDCGRRILRKAETASGQRLAKFRTSEVIDELEALPRGSYVFVVEGVDRGSRLDLNSEGTFTIGRDGADFPLQDPFLSRLHVEIKADGNRWLINDLESTNGSFLNDIPVKGQELLDGDQIEIGYTTLIFHVKL